MVCRLYDEHDGRKCSKILTDFQQVYGQGNWRIEPATAADAQFQQVIGLGREDGR